MACLMLYDLIIKLTDVFIFIKFKIKTSSHGFSYNNFASLYLPREKIISALIIAPVNILLNPSCLNNLLV